MKNLIKINPTSFILGAVFGGVAIFTVAADSHHPTDWRYRVVEQDCRYFTYGDYTEAIAKSATNDWEFVSAQIIPKSSEDVFEGARVMIIQKQAKE
jgi:hypothetical protein